MHVDAKTFQSGVLFADVLQALRMLHWRKCVGKELRLSAADYFYEHLLVMPAPMHVVCPSLLASIRVRIS